MKQLVTVILFICLNAQCLVKLGIMTWYSYNKEYVTEQFCVNKEKPELQCNGKCYLKKQLKNTGDIGDIQSNKKLPEKSESIFIEVVLPGIFSLCQRVFNQLPEQFYRYAEDMHKQYFMSVLHPPPNSFFPC